MPSSRVVRVVPPGVVEQGDSVAAQQLRNGIAAIQAELHVVTAFPDDVEQAAAAAAASPRLPDLDRTDIPFVTIDPATSMDLDQALHLERGGTGAPDGTAYTVHYAIADLAAFITPGDPVDLEAHRRGETLYGADSKVPLHPKVISEAAGSLLPGQVRPALLWTISLDEHGEAVATRVERARVRSTAKLDYAGVQQQVDAGQAGEVLQLLQVVGELRLAREAARGGVSLPLPEQEVHIEGERWSPEFRSLLPVESWNAQISLLTGFAAASMMVYARVGLLRTLPPPDPRDVTRLHRTAKALGINWPAEQHYPDFIRGLDPSQPAHAAMVVACTRLLRGSGYVAFDGELPALHEHAALASEYAHVTAPLRRLGDRYAGEVCLALCAGTDVPGWVHDALPGLPDTLRDSARRAHAYENAILDLVEAGVLQDDVGHTFTGVVVSVDEKNPRRGSVTIAEPAIEAHVTSTDADLPLGHEVQVRLVAADVTTRHVELVVE